MKMEKGEARRAGRERWKSGIFVSARINDRGAKRFQEGNEAAARSGSGHCFRPSDRTSLDFIIAGLNAGTRFSLLRSPCAVMRNSVSYNRVSLQKHERPPPPPSVGDASRFHGIDDAPDEIIEDS